MVSLKMFLEKKFSIKIPDEKATPEAFDSVNNIIKLLKEFTQEV
jgi:acyl carrier protein